MRCEFFVKTSGGIHVIPEFEVNQLCLLEGSNGIGKTLAVRLLELATGRQPYVAAQSAWRSLRAGLGELRIRISQLCNGDTLEIELTPSTWPDDPIKGAMEEPGRAWYNGQIIDIQTIPSILHVTRIAGDEDIITQFQRVITADSTVVGRQYVRLNTSIDRLINECNDLLQDIKNISRTHLEQLIVQQEQAEEQLTSAIQAHEQQSTIVQALDQLARKQTALRKLQEQGPGIESQMTEIEAKLGKLQPDIDKLEARRALYLPDASREAALLDEIKQLRRKQERQADKSHVAATKLSNTLADLQLSNVSEITIARHQTSAKLDELRHERELLITPPDLIALIRQLRMKLETVRGSSLDTEVVAKIGQRAVQTRELRDGLVQREQELARVEQQNFSAVIDANIQSLRNHLQHLVEAEKLQNDLMQKQRILAETEDSLRMKIAELNTNRSAEYQQVAEELQHLQQRELALIEERATLRSTKSILEEHGTADKLAAEIASVGNSLPETTETFEEEQTRLTVYWNRVQEAREELRQAKDALAAFERKLQDTLTLLNQGSDYAWLRAAVTNQLPTMNDDRSVALEWLGRLKQAIWRFVELLTTLSNRTGRLKSALEFLAQNNTQEELNGYLPVITVYYEQRFGMLLADPNVRHVLFDNGTFMQLDLQEHVIIWKDANGETCRRPLEAFSSGERAFAHVLGSILQQRQVTAQNHLLVLDEFGAFIEAGRIERLVRFLHDEVLQAEGVSAVVVILPLREQIPSAYDGSDRDIRMLVERGYRMKEVKLSV